MHRRTRRERSLHRGVSVRDGDPVRRYRSTRRARCRQQRSRHRRGQRNRHPLQQQISGRYRSVRQVQLARQPRTERPLIEVHRSRNVFDDDNNDDNNVFRLDFDWDNFDGDNLDKHSQHDNAR